MNYRRMSDNIESPKNTVPAHVSLHVNQNTDFHPPMLDDMAINMPPIVNGPFTCPVCYEEQPSDQASPPLSCSHASSSSSSYSSYCIHDIPLFSQTTFLSIGSYYHTTLTVLLSNQYRDSD